MATKRAEDFINAHDVFDPTLYELYLEDQAKRKDVDEDTLTRIHQDLVSLRIMFSHSNRLFCAHEVIGFVIGEKSLSDSDEDDE